MFKDTKEGSTHHDKDACYKCKICGAHYFIKDEVEKCVHHTRSCNYYKFPGCRGMTCHPCNCK